jgi:hypothetical protein
MAKIERLADEALSEYENGKTEPVENLCGEIPIPAEMLDAAFEVIVKRLFPVSWHFVLSSPSCQEYADTRMLAKAALEAANRAAPPFARDGLRARVGMALFQNGYDNGYTTDGAVEAIELMAARIAELEKQLAQDQADFALLGAEQLGGSSLKLTMAIYDKWVKEQGDKMMLARITELEAELSRHQESQFHPDWSALEATRESLREAWAKLKEMEQTAADALREAANDDQNEASKTY